MRTGLLAQKMGMTRVFTEEAASRSGHRAQDGRLSGGRRAHRG